MISRISNIYHSNYILIAGEPIPVIYIQNDGLKWINTF